MEIDSEILKFNRRIAKYFLSKYKKNFTSSSSSSSSSDDDDDDDNVSTYFHIICLYVHDIRRSVSLKKML